MPPGFSLLGLSDYLIDLVEGLQSVTLHVRYIGKVHCPHCRSESLRNKGMFERTVRHENWGQRRCFLRLKGHKFQCCSCQRSFRQRFPGIQPYRRSSELFRRQIVTAHEEGISQRALARRERIGTATVERWYQDFLKLKVREHQSRTCPRVLGIDEHFFSRKDGYATTFCNLGSQKVFDVVLGRSEAALRPYLTRLPGREHVQVVCMDLSTTYRSIVKTYFPNALIVADRFHVIRLINQQFLAVWSQLDPQGRANRGLLSLVRRHEWNLKADQRVRLEQYLNEHPVFKAVYEFKQRLCRIMKIKRRTKQQCKRLVPFLLIAIRQLKESKFGPMMQLGETLDSWKEEIARMWRFTKSNGITEGFHNKMEMISRRAFGFRNFENYRLRVKVLCA